MAEEKPLVTEKLKPRDLLATHRPSDVDPTGYATAQGAVADADLAGYNDAEAVEITFSHGGEHGLKEGLTDTGAYILAEKTSQVKTILEAAKEREQWKQEGEPGPIKKWLRSIAVNNDIGWLKRLTGIKPKKKAKYENKGGEYVRKFDL